MERKKVEIENGKAYALERKKGQLSIARMGIGHTLRVSFLTEAQAQL